MNGTIFYGPLGRVISALSYVSLLIVAMQIGGLMNLLPPKAAAILLAVGATLTAFNERVQGGASKPEVRAAAQGADDKNANDKGIELDEINR